MKLHLMVVVPVIAFAGCASNTGVVPIGQDAYMISKQQATGFPGLGNITAENIAEGSAYCARLGKRFEVVNIKETQPPYILGNYPRSDVRFTCVADAKKAPASNNAIQSPSNNI